MTLANRIAVMDKGRLIQVGTPKEIYEYPNSRFVADFIGTINMFDGTVVSFDGDRVRVNCNEAGGELVALSDSPPAAGSAVCVAVRPEKIFISKHEPDNNEDTRLAGIVEDLGYFGNLSLYRIRLETGRIVQVSAQNSRRSAERFLEWDDKVFISWRPRSAVLLTD